MSLIDPILNSPKQLFAKLEKFCNMRHIKADMTADDMPHYIFNLLRDNQNYDVDQEAVSFFLRSLDNSIYAALGFTSSLLPLQLGFRMGEDKDKKRQNVIQRLKENVKQSDEKKEAVNHQSIDKEKLNQIKALWSSWPYTKMHNQMEALKVASATEFNYVKKALESKDINRAILAISYFGHSIKSSSEFKELEDVREFTLQDNAFELISLENEELPYEMMQQICHLEDQLKQQKVELDAQERQLCLKNKKDSVFLRKQLEEKQNKLEDFLFGLNAIKGLLQHKQPSEQKVAEANEAEAKRCIDNILLGDKLHNFYQICRDKRANHENDLINFQTSMSETPSNPEVMAKARSHA